MPIVAVMSDFHTDYYHAVMKAVIAKNLPPKIREKTQFIDIPINSQFNIISAAWAIKNTYKYFPEKTVFLSVIDPGVGTKRKPILVKANNQYFIGPNNGIFTSVTEEKWEAYEILPEKIRQYQENQSNTFHGRDIFAPATAKTIHLISEGKEPDQDTIGPKIENIKKVEIQTVKTGEKGKIVYIDGFGNIVTNVETQTKENKIFTLKTSNQTITLEKHDTFEEGPRDKPFLIIGSCGTLEIVKKQDSAAKHFPDLLPGKTIWIQ